MPPRAKKTTSSYNTVVLQRLFQDAPKDRNGEVVEHVAQMNSYADAVLDFVIEKDNVDSFCLTSDCDWLVNCENVVINMSDDIELVVTEIKRRSVSDVQSVTLEVRSNVKSAAKLKEWIRCIHVKHHENRCKALTCQPCIFEQLDRGNPDVRGNPFEDPYQRKQFEISNAKKYLSFIKCPFHSNKNFESLVGLEANKVRERVSFFLENKAWYDNKGVPYSLTIMLSGASGSGKSSCIKAIANKTKRHIVNVNFNRIQTGSQLRRLFQSDDLHVYTDDDGHIVDRVRIPLNQRIYVLEEIDAVGDGSIVKDRRLNKHAQSTTSTDEITLADILQVLDGTMETPGRIIVITSNYPESLDHALVRPGRIDLSIKFTKATRQATIDLYERLMDTKFPIEKVDELPDQEISLADVTEIVFRNFDRPVHCFIEDVCSVAIEKRAKEEFIQIEENKAKLMEMAIQSQQRRHKSTPLFNENKADDDIQKLVNGVC